MPTQQPDLFDPGRSADFVAILQALRHDDPVFFFEHEDFSAWVITRHEDVVTLLRDKRLGVPALGTRMASFSKAQQAELEPMREFIADNLGRTRQRRLALRQATKLLFRPGAVARLRPRVRALVDQLIEAVDIALPVDLIGDFAYPLPAIVMAELLGAPSRDRERFIPWSKALIEFHRAYDFESMRAAQEGVLEMLEYCARQIEDRVGHGSEPEDMLGVFAVLLEQGRFEMGELAASCATFLMAGHENTTHLIGNLFHCLFSHPEQLEALKAAPSLIPQAIHETLRYNGVVPFLTREVEETFDFRGHRFEKGELISLSLFSANRDAEVFDHPDEFDIHQRRARQQLGFGHGANQCRGSHLAMIEAEGLLAVLLERFPGMAPVEGGMELQCRPMLRRYVTRYEIRLVPPT